MIKVLVVDDETFVRRGIVMETDWKSLDCEVVAEAANGEEALEAVHKFSPDLIISDIKMPKMDGIEFLKSLRAEGNNVHLIFLTAYSDFEYAKQALRLFAFDYLLKPFEDGELEAAVRRAQAAIEGKRAEDKEALAGSILDSANTYSHSAYVQQALTFISENYENPDISIGMVADHVGVSEGHLSHLFKKETEYTVSSYITRYRMRAAMRLLEDCRNRVSEVAEKVGYKDVAYFSSTFKKIVGENPSEYQARR